ncbi:MAG TPA: DUF6602 domain-containing protein [Candidatus Binataceae bacterium]|nr:DUF6602 domain-containing protein [Candidatus Binataceae bacterium]
MKSDSKEPNQSRTTENARALPDTTTWKPRDASQTLTAVFAEECRASETKLLHGLQHERRLAIDNFDSGLPFEGLVREELKRLLPRRYSVTTGLLLDRLGRTAGNCDVVIFNDTWFQPVKSPATENSGGKFIPIEGVYAVGEVKQTLSSSELDQAMEKLVKCQRLDRPRTFAHRIVENRKGCDCQHGLTNPLISFILAGALAANESLQDLIERFFDISKELKRLEVVRALCVLGEGTVLWSFHDPLSNNEVCPATFVEADLFRPIFPIFSPASYRSPLLCLVQMLQLSLFHIVLGPEDFAAAYSLDRSGIKLPSNPNIALPADKEWLDLLNKPCRSPDR